jgi:head-tail adaptor
VRAGRFDRTITLLARSVARDSFGAGTETFTAIADDVPAEVIYDRGGELSRQNDAQRQAQAVVTFRIRWRPGLTRDMRIRFDGADYDVTDIMEIGRRRGADLRTIASVP